MDVANDLQIGVRKSKIRGGGMKKRTRVALALGIGFGLAILSMAITIYFGDVHAYSSGKTINEVPLWLCPIMVYGSY